MSAAGQDTVDGTVEKKTEVAEKAKEENGKKPESGEPGEGAIG
jgi:hypothetical protein